MELHVHASLNLSPPPLPMSSFIPTPLFIWPPGRSYKDSSRAPALSPRNAIKDVITESPHHTPLMRKTQYGATGHTLRETVCTCPGGAQSPSPILPGYLHGLPRMASPTHPSWANCLHWERCWLTQYPRSINKIKRLDKYIILPQRQTSPPRPGQNKQQTMYQPLIRASGERWAVHVMCVKRNT